MNKEEILIMQSKYELSHEENRRYYEEVKAFFTLGKYAEKKTKLILVVGQPGAGKSKLMRLVNKRLHFNAVISDIDTIRAMHPKFSIAYAQVPEFINLALLTDVNKIGPELRKYYMEQGLNLIYEGTMRSTAGYVEMAKQYKERGYDIELDFMAVSKLESYGSSLLRYAIDLCNNNFPRWVAKNIHDEAYENMITTLEELSKQSLFDSARVYCRGNDEEQNPIKIYSTEERQFGNVKEAILYGREKDRRKAIEDYPMKYKIVSNIFSNYAPELLSKLDVWEELYEDEKGNLKSEVQERN